MTFLGSKVKCNNCGADGEGDDGEVVTLVLSAPQHRCYECGSYDLEVTLISNKTENEAKQGVN